MKKKYVILTYDEKEVNNLQLMKLYLTKVFRERSKRRSLQRIFVQSGTYSDAVIFYVMMKTTKRKLREN
ncbi:MAG: hypothetical protein ACLTJ5_06750 [Clostridium sp.]